MVMDKNDFATKNDLKLLRGDVQQDLNNLEKRLEKKVVEVINEAVDKLAVAVAKGFEETATKEELRAVEKRLDNLEEGQEEIKAQIIFMTDDIKNLKEDTVTDSQFLNHEKRIGKLEKAVFTS